MIFSRSFIQGLPKKIAFNCIQLNNKLLQNSTVQNKIITKKPLNVSLLKYSFSSNSETYFIFNHQTQPDLLKLELQYRANQNASIFDHTVKNSTGLLDQMRIFKIFKVMQSSTYNHNAYEIFYQIVQKNVKRKSDNMLLLLATVKNRMAGYYKNQNQFQNSLKSYQQALDILQGSMVPPLFPYYSIYREYGLLHDRLRDKDKAIQILSQSVDILQDFVSHSDDNVFTNDYCKKQATAYNVLARLDKQNMKKWVQKANSMWQKYTQNRYDQVQYAITVLENMKKLLLQDKQKAQAFYHFNLYKFQNKQMKELLKKVKQEVIQTTKSEVK